MVIDREMFYGHAVSSVDSRRADVRFWQKNVLKYWLTAYSAEPAQEKECGLVN